jgi:hypothetical protein
MRCSVVTDGGFGKRTRLAEYKRQGRGGQGVLTARIEEKRGQLVGALIVQDADEIFCITSSGVVIRMSVSPLRFLSRPTGGVKLVALDAGSTVVAVAHNGEAAADAVTAQAPDAGSDGLADEVLTQDDAPMSQTPPVDGAETAPSRLWTVLTTAPTRIRPAGTIRQTTARTREGRHDRTARCRERTSPVERRTGRRAAASTSPSTSTSAPTSAPTTASAGPVATSTRATAPRDAQSEDPPTTILPTGGGRGSAPGGGAGTSSEAGPVPGTPGTASTVRTAPPRTVPPRPVGRSDPRTSPGRSALSVGRSRRARLSLRRIDPWSVFVFTLVASVFVGIALVVAVAVLFSVLSSLGVVGSINELFAEVTGGLQESGPLLTLRRIVTGAAVLAALNIVFLTLLATLSALLYNLCASFTGGIELTLGEHD